MARERFEQGEYMEAVFLLEESPEAAGREDAETRIGTQRLLGWCHHRLGDDSVASQIFGALSREDPKDTEALIGLGLSSFGAGDDAECIRALDRALGRKPSLTSLRVTLARALYRQGFVSRARGQFSRARSKYREAVAPLVGLAWCGYRQGRVKSAETHFRKALELAASAVPAPSGHLPADEPALYSEVERTARERRTRDIEAGLGFCAAARKSPEDAARWLQPLAAAVPGTPAGWGFESELLMIYASALRDTGRPSEGLAAFDRMLARHAEGRHAAQAWCGRGWCAIDLGMHEPAHAAFRKALEIWPGMKSAVDGLRTATRLAAAAPAESGEGGEGPSPSGGGTPTGGGMKGGGMKGGGTKGGGMKGGGMKGGGMKSGGMKGGGMKGGGRMR